MHANPDWNTVQANPTFFPGALTDSEGSRIKWHSPGDPRSSQVFCISAFGALRFLPDSDEILNNLICPILPISANARNWKLCFEHVDRNLLGETGSGEPTNIDVSCSSATAFVCIELKFYFDAIEGFGCCDQAKKAKCAGYYGRGSDLKTRSEANCRLEIKDRSRGPRRYWNIGKAYFIDGTFRQQTDGEICPFSGPNFQLMRNFLFAATAATDTRQFGMMAIVPKRTAAKIAAQVQSFKTDVVMNKYRERINVKTYDEFVLLLTQSNHPASNRLGHFLSERISTLL